MKCKQKFLAAMAVLVLLVSWIIWGNRTVEVTEYTISSAEVPTVFHGYRIVQVSDLHNAEFGEDNGELLHIIKSSEPDMIVLTGDFVDSRHTDIDIALRFAEKAVHIAPVYYVTGNHEARIQKSGQYAKLKDGLLGCGVVVLENECVTLTKQDAQIHLLGLQDPAFGGSVSSIYTDGSSLKQQLETLCSESAGYTILLSHRPELFDIYTDCNVNLVFSGHAHGGQFRLPFIGGLIAPGQGLFPQYDAGLYNERDTDMIVSRGLGNSLFPFRVNNRPELTVVELQSK